MSAPVGLEFKNVASPDALPADSAGAMNEGVIEALVAVTGVKDDVGDVIVPGAFRNTLDNRKPKVCLGHDWNRPIGKVLQVKELEPGHKDLPKTTADGKPWPKEAGAVWAQFQVNMDIDDGKNAFHSAKFYGPESTYSIGYKATTAKHRGGTRYIHELDLFEFGPVLHPANRLATLQSIKSGEPEGIEYTDAELDEEKGVTVEELTLRDYAAILEIMEEKAAKIRRVSDSSYWGLPVGTIIRPGMKPQGTGKGGTTNRGLTTAKPANAPKSRPAKVGEFAVTRDGYAGEVIAIKGDKVTIFKPGESAKTFDLGDVTRGAASSDAPIALKPTKSMEQAAANVFDGDGGVSPEELGASYAKGVLTITDLGRAIDAVDSELEIMEDNEDRKKSAGASTRALRKKLASLADFDDDEPAGEPDAVPADESETEVAKPAAAKAETEQDVRKVAEELDLEMRPNPAHPDYIIKPPPAVFNRSGERVMSFDASTGKAQASNGQVIPAGRVEEFLRTWQQEMDKSTTGYPPRADWVLSQMDKPAREAAAKAESDRKKRETVANATNEELAGQAEFEVDRLMRFDDLRREMLAEGRTFDETAAERTRAHGLANLELVNAELVKRGLPAHELPGAKLSTKPTGGRSVQEILDSIPDNREGGAARYDISNGADVLDDPTGSGVFAVGPLPDADKNSARSQWTITLGNGLSIPASAIVRAVSDEKAINVSTPKKVTAWLKAMGELRGADGNPPPYGTATGPELLAWRDSEGRSLKEALTEVVAPAYLKAIGKSGARSGDGGDKTKPANWRSNPALAATKLPSVMFSQFTDLGQNGKQAYILGRTEGDDHATALQRAKDMVANARSARESAEAARAALPTGPSYAPVNRTITTDDNGAEATPEGEISTTRLLSLDRTSGPAAVARMEIPELERHDAELTRRAEALGRAGVVSPAHQAIKDALRAKQDQQRREERAAAEAAESPEQRRQRQIEEAPAKVADARRLGRMSRGEIALREANKEIPLDDVSGNAYNVMRSTGGEDGAREDGVASAELARNIASDAEFLARADTADQVADLIDSWGVDLGEESDLPAKLRAWSEGLRSVLNAPPVDPEILKIRQELAQHPDNVQEARRTGWSPRGLMAFTLATQRLGMNINPVGYTILNENMSADEVRDEARERARGGFARYGADRAQQVQQAVDEIDSWGVDLGEGQRTVDNARAWVEGTREGIAEYEAANPPTPNLTLAPSTPTVNEQEENRRYQAAVDRAAATQAATPDQATARTNAQARREAVRQGDAAPRPEAPTPAPVSEVGAGSFLTAEDRAEMDRLRAEGRDNEAAKYYADARRRARAEGTRDEATITPELLDEAAESEAASVGLTETPDGALEVEPEIAERQDRVEKLIKDADDGKLNLADQSTEDLTSTRRDLVDELRLQTAIRRRTPRAPRPATDAPKVRPGLAGAAEDHAEALRSGDAAAIERTQARLQSSIRRSRVDSEIARSLADSIASPDDNDADQLSDLAKRLRAESRERRNASARKRRTAKRIERERIQSLLGAVDTELRGRGVELEQVSPELLAPDPEGDSRPNLTAKMRDVLLTARSDGTLDGHLNTIYGLMTHNLVQRAPGGDRNFRLTPEGEAEVALLRDRTTDSTAGANVVLLNQDQVIENDIHQAYAGLADGEEDWVRLAEVFKRVDIPPADWQRVLTAMSKTGLVHLVPDSNRKVLTDEDRAAAVRIGSEDKNLIAFDRDYVRPGGGSMAGV